MGCLYRLTFPSGKAYIGVTVGTAAGRFAEHAYNAKRGLSRGVNRAMRKYGADSVKVETLVIANDWAYLLDLECKAIAAFGTKGAGGYNMTDGGEGALGYKHTPESLAKMSAVHVGKAHHTTPHSQETKAMMSQRRTGKKPNLSPERRAAMAASMRGNTYAAGSVWTEERRALQVAKLTGIDRGDAWRAKMSEVSKVREAKKREARRGV